MSEGEETGSASRKRLVRSLIARIRTLLQREDFRRNPIRGVWRRVRWRWRWRGNQQPWELPFGPGLRVLVPMSGPGALLYYQGASELDTARFLESRLRAGMVFADVGAHFGEYVLLAAQAVGPAGEVHAFEPDARTFDLLTGSIRLNGFQNVVANQAAISDVDGWRRLWPAAEMALSRLAAGKSLESAKEGTVRVASTTFDTYWRGRERRPDLVKVDVEGAELLVLKGAQELMRSGITWIFEYCPRNLAAFGHCPHDLLGAFRQRGYDVFRLYAGGRLERVVRPDRLPEICNLVAMQGDLRP